MIGEVFYKINRDSRSGDFESHPFLCYVVKGIDKLTYKTDSRIKDKTFYHVIILNQFNHTLNPKIEYGNPSKDIKIDIGDLILPSEYQDIRDILHKEGYYLKDNINLKKQYYDLCKMESDNDKRKLDALKEKIKLSDTYLDNLKKQFED